MTKIKRMDRKSRKEEGEEERVVEAKKKRGRRGGRKERGRCVEIEEEEARGEARARRLLQ